MRGMLSDEKTSIIAEGISARISSRMSELGDLLDVCPPDNAVEIAKNQAARRELKEILKDFDLENIRKRNFMLDKQLKELQGAIETKTRTGTSGPVPPR
jgi:hypothetical protein